MWKPIARLDGYFVNECGEILSKQKKYPRILTVKLRADGYFAAQTTVLGKKKRIYPHREVAKAFIPNPNRYERVKHIDGDVSNNHVENLCWTKVIAAPCRVREAPKTHEPVKAVTLEAIVSQNEEGKMLVSGRMLHAFLGIGKVFGAWMPRMIDYGFEEGIDYFVCFPKMESEHRGGQNKKEYALTLDMAKEICMIQRSEKGRIARKYFIDCEKKLKEVTAMPALPDFTNPAEAAEAWAKQYRLGQEATKALEAAKPKAEYYDRLVDANHLTNLRDTAKELGVPQNKFISALLDKGFLYRDNNGRLRPYASKKGYFSLKERNFANGKTGCQTFVTVKGKNEMRKLFKEYRL